VLTPNVSGSVRVDVVEIQRDPGLVLESDSRDIFDPSTGTFAPAPVDKVIADKVRYRIRLGVPGAGLPANALGWMPIAVVAVPNLAVTFDLCIIYDVRPLESDRPSPGMRAFRLAPEITRSFYVDGVTVPGVLRCVARVEGPGVDGYWAGGEFSVDLRDPTIREPGFGAITANQLLYLWALYPGGLPRWVRYTAVAIPPFGGRIPGGTRGILCLSKKSPLVAAYAGLNPSTPVALPPDSGFDFGASAFGQLMLVNANDSGGVNVASIANCKRGRMSFAAGVAGPTILPVVAITATIDRYRMTYGTHIPYGARAVLILGACRFTGAPGTEFTYDEVMLLKHPTVGGPIYGSELRTGIAEVIPAAGFVDVSFAKWIDLITDFAAVTTAPNEQIVESQWNQVGVAKVAEVSAVFGWEL